MAFLLPSAITGLVELLFEPVCHGCGRLTDRLPSHGEPVESPRTGITPAAGKIESIAQTFRKTTWCNDCLRDMLAAPEQTCTRCGAELPSVRPAERSCRLCRTLEWRFERAVTIGNYHRTLSEMVVRMKGLRDESLAWQLGLLLGEKLARKWDTEPPEARPELVLPVPTWWTRRLKRGFVAAEILAEAVALQNRLPFHSGLLRCCRATAKQGTLSTAARFRNVSGMFSVKPNQRLDGKRVLLVDDVLTSGATASQAAGVLLRSGRTSTVTVAVVARGARGN